MAKKKEYVKRLGREGADDGWHFLTGGEESIKALAAAVGFRYAYDAETDLFIHASGIMVATPGGELARYIYGVEYPPRDLRLALVEASEGRIGTITDQVLLFCYHYDPVTGKYSVAALSLIRMGGIITLAIIAGFVVRMLRKDAAARRSPHDVGAGT
jgi:protein SCO1/2